MKPETLIQHLGEETHDRGAVTPPIYQTSLFVFDEVDHMNPSSPEKLREDRPFVYSRVTNPTNRIVEKKIAKLEKTDSARLFSSGMGAMTAAIMHCVRAGSHVVCIDSVYGPTRQFLESYLPKFGVETTFVPGDDPNDFIAAMKENTTLVYLESPSSVLFRFQDIRAITAECRKRGIKSVIDNSYASPLYQQPATMGVDLICHTASKYLGGHSDLVAGVLCGPADMIDEIAGNEMELIGGTLPPFPAWLILRGMRTLALRMKHAHEVGNTVAEYLHEHPAIAEVIHAGAKWHPQRALYESQMSGSGSVLSFVPKCQDPVKIKAFARDLEHFQIGVSWGGYESLVTVHNPKAMDWSESKWLVRIYCGLEDTDDLIEDLAQSIAKNLE